MCIYLSLETKTKKLYLLLLLFLIAYIVHLFIISYYNNSNYNEVFYVDDFILIIGQVLVILPYIIYKIYNLFSKKYDNNKKNKIQKSNINKKDYIILIVIIIINFLYDLIKIRQKIQFSFINKAILFIFLSLLMKIINKTILYRHRIIALIMFTIFSFLIDIILYDKDYDYDNDNKNFFISKIINFCGDFLNAIILTYQQYLISTKNISFYTVCFFYGLLEFISLAIILIISSKNGYYLIFNGEEKQISTFYKEKIFKNFFDLLFKSLPLIVINTIIFHIYFYIVYTFSIIHAVIINVFLNINEILYAIFIKEHKSFYKKYGLYNLIIFSLIFIFILVSIFIYLEIIELKFF